MTSCTIHPGSNISYSTWSSVKTTLTVVTSVAVRSLSAIKDLLLFPCRYVGSKTWSLPGLIFTVPYFVFKRAIFPNKERTLKEEIFGTGYSFNFERQLTPSEAKSYITPASLTCFAHTSNPRWAESQGYKAVNLHSLGVFDKNLIVNDYSYFDESTGLKIVLSEKEDEIVVSFGAITSSRSLLSDNPSRSNIVDSKLQSSAVLNLFGIKPTIYLQANEVFEKLSQTEKFQGKKITVTGHSFGGGLAQFVGLKQRVKTYCFNAVPMGAGLQSEIKKEHLQDADKYLTHVVTKTDYLNDRIPVRAFDRVLSLIGIRTSGNFGKCYLIPSPHSHFQEIHGLFYESLTKYSESNL